MSEFSLIRRHFTRATPGAVLGVGDDAALLQVAAGQVLAVSSDMLVAGTHFFADADPFLLGHKTLAVNISDLAAMGAQPRWATLAVSLPKADDAWLERFSAGWFTLAGQHGVELVGGDTTRGPLNFSVTIMGEVPAHAALRRDGAKVGDDIWVSGALGDAALALAHLQGRIALGADQLAACASRLHQPQPRVALGLALRGMAHSAIDISDGLLADLGHILERSGAGAELHFAALPLSPALRALGSNEAELLQRCVLSGGDDYELCFTAAEACREPLAQLSRRLELPLTRIGKVTPGRACVVRDAGGKEMTREAGGYDHFA